MSTTFSKNNVPYTYLLKWSKTGAWYYGVRFSKSCHPDDLWISYFTASKHVRSYVHIHGDPDIISVRKTFSDAIAARKWEHRVLQKMAVLARADCLNKTDNKSIDPMVCALHTRGKTYEEIYGLEKAQELRRMRVLSSKNKAPTKHNAVSKKRMSETRRGGNNSNSKSISIQIEDQSYNFTCRDDCYKFIATRFGITWCNARYVITAKQQGKQIPCRKNYQMLQTVSKQIRINATVKLPMEA